MEVHVEKECIAMASSDIFPTFCLLKSTYNTFVSILTEQHLLPRNPGIIK